MVVENRYTLIQEKKFHVRANHVMHSDYVSGPIWTHGRYVDVMIEAKMKEAALLRYVS